MPRPSRAVPTLPTDIPRVVARRSDLLAGGATSREITAAIHDGRLIRPRRDRYLPGDCHPMMAEAVRLGGRVDCTSLLRLYDVFVLDDTRTHVRLPPHASRVAPPREGIVRHWVDSSAPDEATVVPVIEALVHAVLCQPPRAAIATLDSAWHVRLVDEGDIAEVFQRLPRRFRRLRPLLDPRSEAGTETLVRLMLRGLGVAPELQVKIVGVGYVDFLVDGWLIIECDSAAHHSDWAARRRDIRRDAAAIRLGYVPLRLLADDILFHPEEVLALLREVLGGGANRRPRS